jgi:large subunit ribosomal protein L5
MAEQKTKAPKGGDNKGKTEGAKAKGRGDKVATLPTDPAPKVAVGKPRLQAFYEETVRPRLAKSFALANPHQVPKISKVVLNVGMGDAGKNPKQLDAAVEELAAVTGQKPVITKAKKSIAIWKLRTGYPLGCMVTLRQERMYEFLDRLVSIALPRVRDFRGVSGRSFDGRGNFSMGVKEQIIFPEIEYDKIDTLRGMNITIATTAKTDAEAKALLAAFKFPFKN